MSTALGNELPKELAQDLDGRNVAAKWSRIIPLVSVDERGFPHFAVLTYGEIVAPSRAELRLGLYPNSSTTRNIQARPEVSLLIVHGDSIYYVKGTAQHTPLEALARFDVAIHQVLVDSEPGARITAGLQFEMSQGKDAWLAQAQKTLAALR